MWVTAMSKLALSDSFPADRYLWCRSLLHHSACLVDSRISTQLLRSPSPPSPIVVLFFSTPLHCLLRPLQMPLHFRLLQCCPPDGVRTYSAWHIKHGCSPDASFYHWDHQLWLVSFILRSLASKLSFQATILHTSSPSPSATNQRSST